MKNMLKVLACTLALGALGTGAAHASSFVSANVSSVPVTEAASLAVQVSGSLQVYMVKAQVEESTVDTVLSLYENCSSTNTVSLLDTYVLQASSGSNVGSGSAGMAMTSYYFPPQALAAKDICLRKKDASGTVHAFVLYR